MSETLNVNVLVAAKEEYTRQLVYTIQQDVYEILKSIFNDSQEKNIRRKISYSNFQLELKEVPQWTSYKLDSKIKDLIKKYTFLMDLITAIFVSHVKILACVRLKSDDKSIKIKVPNLSTFLHKLLIKCCETLYYEPQLINSEKCRLIEIISISIEDTIANQIPIEYILNEYLAGAFDDEEPLNDLNGNANTNTNVNELNLEKMPEIADEYATDNESDANSEDGECKNIPILPIKNRSGFQESLKPDINKEPNIDLDDISVHKNENENENENANENANANENRVNHETKSEQILNKSTKIDDNSDEEYSDEDISGEELSENENENENENPIVKKNRSLF
jgi:hypothetical protein